MTTLLLIWAFVATNAFFYAMVRWRVTINLSEQILKSNEALLELCERHEREHQRELSVLRGEERNTLQ